MKTILFILIFLCLLADCNLQFSQNITNTLGTNGVFKIKDGSTDYLTLSQASGNLTLNQSMVLPVTTSSATGIIFKGIDRFLHNFGTNNTFLGVNSGNFTMTGVSNTAVGNLTLYSNTTGSYNIALGGAALQLNTTGSGNTALGLGCLLLNTSGNYNTAVGGYSLLRNSDGIQNTALGYESLNFNNIGSDNSAIGFQSLYANTSGIYNTAVGSSSLSANTTGIGNTAFGYQSLYRNTTASSNTAIGYFSLRSNTTGNSNIAIGVNSLFTNNTGLQNTAVGINSLKDNSIGSFNTAVGNGSLLHNTGGNNNTAVGYNALQENTLGSNNTAIGYDAQLLNFGFSNQVRIGNTAVTFAGIQVAWSISSDKRLKSNIFNSNLGLEFISKLNPVSYTRINDESKKTEYGLIAQEVEEVLKELNIGNTGMLVIDDKGMYELRYNDLLAPMVKAIQELSEGLLAEKTENDELKNNNEKLSAEVESLKSMNGKMAKLEQMVNELVSVKNASLSDSK